MDPNVQGSFIPKQALTAASRGSGMGLFFLLAQARTLLRSHVSPSAIFYFLSTVTLEKVQFNSFDLAVNKNGGATMTLSGTADSFSTVALQSDQLGASKVLRDVLFSGITVAETGKVSFTVNAGVDPDLILYSSNLKQQSAQQ